MRHLGLVVLALLVATSAAAQDPAAPPGEGGSRFFGGPIVQYTVLRDQGAVMFGTLTAWRLTPSWALGIALAGTLDNVDGPTGVPYAPGPLDLKMETFGVDLTYTPRPAARTRLTFGAVVGGAASHYVRDGTKEQHGETDFMLLVEPGVGVEQVFAHWLRLELRGSYRLVSGVEQVRLETGDISGPSLTLAAKFGRF